MAVFHLSVPSLFVRCPCVCSAWCDNTKHWRDCSTAQIELGNQVNSVSNVHFILLTCIIDINSIAFQLLFLYMQDVQWYKTHHIANWINKSVQIFKLTLNVISIHWLSDLKLDWPHFLVSLHIPVCSHVTVLAPCDTQGTVVYWALSEVAHVCGGLFYGNDAQELVGNFTKLCLQLGILTITVNDLSVHPLPAVRGTCHNSHTILLR